MTTTTTQQLPTRFIQIEGGGKIAYDDTADAAAGVAGVAGAVGSSGAARKPIVVCTPGLGDNRTSFRHLRPLLVAAGYRVVTMDLRGQGASTAEWDDYSTPAMAADVIALVRRLDAGPVALLSNSYTGGPSFLAAAQAPELFAGLVMTSPFARVQPPMSVLMRAGEAVVTRVAAGWMAYWGSLFKTRKPQDFAEARKALAASLREPGRMAALRAMNDASQAPGEAAAARVACPVLVVMGSRDPDFKDPAAEGAAVANLVPDGRVRVVEGAGHYPHAEFPEETSEIVLNFLRELRRSVTA
jgi:pimeloyl-ACP methyl ester carboxylesterase